MGINVLTIPNSDVQIRLSDFPLETGSHIVHFLSPEEKKVLACVSWKIRLLAEDSHLLLEDLNAGKSLSNRQISILIEDPNIEIDLVYKAMLAFADQINFNAPIVISEKLFVSLLRRFASKGILESQSAQPNSKWGGHLDRLIKFERCFRLSDSFSYQKTLSNYSEHIKFMKAQGFNIDGVLSNPYGTPLSRAAFFKSPILLEALLQVGAKVDKAIDSDNMLPIHQLSSLPTLTPNRLELFSMNPEFQRLAIQCLDIFVKYGADPNASTLSAKKTPLWFAAQFGQSEIIKALVKFGADVNIETNERILKTPLHAAVLSGNDEAVRTLVETCRADFQKKNSQRETAFKLAKKYGQVTIALYLGKLEGIKHVDFSPSLPPPPRCAFAITRFLSKVALIPLIGTIAAIAKIALATIYALGAICVVPFRSGADLHLTYALINIAIGVGEAIPLLGTCVAYYSLKGRFHV